MFRKYIAIFCIYVSYIIVFGHNIFPHAHNKTQNTADHHHHKGIGHLFDHYLHSGDSFITTNVNPKTFEVSNECYSVLMPFSYMITKDVLEIRLIFPPPETALIYISPHWSSSGLRAPPVTA